MNGKTRFSGAGRNPLRHRTLVAVLLGTAVAAAGVHAADVRDPAAAQAQTQAQAGQAGQQGLPAPYRLSSWMGKTVWTQDDKKLGEVKELVMDDAAIVRYVIVERDAETDREQKLVAVPLGHFSYQPGKSHELKLDITQAHMRSAPAFQSAGWPNMGDPAWTTTVISYWLAPEAAQQQAGMGQQDMQQQAGVRQEDAERAISYSPNRDMIYLSQEQQALFERLDQDQDGAIQPDEAQQNDRLSNRFDELDTYSNDQLTRSEFSMFEPTEEGN